MSYIEKPEDIVWNVENLAHVDRDAKVVEYQHYELLYKEYLTLKQELEYNKQKQEGK